MSDLPYVLVAVTGPDAFEFLQNQLTNDLQQLDSEDEILAAWCSPKGRVIWFGTVQKTESGYVMSVLTDMAEEFVRRLTMFRFRSRVEFSVEPGGSVDPARLIEIGCPYIGQQQSEQFTPHMLNLDLLGAISMEKGCYPGQEIVARTYYRGKTKRRLHRFESSAQTTPGDKVSDGERDVGDVVNVSGNDLLAVVPVDHSELSINGISLTEVDLPYLERG